MNKQELIEVSTQVRRDIVRMVSAVKSGHPGGSLGCADFLTFLYFDCMKHNSKAFDMDAKNEDVFFLSNGHISPVWYSVLARSGYFPVSELSTFRKISSRLQGHPSTDKNLPGIRMASGSLGQGLSVALGTAETKKLNNDPSIVYSLHGDGELQEGQIWEACEVPVNGDHDLSPLHLLDTGVSPVGAAVLLAQCGQAKSLRVATKREDDAVNHDDA